MILVKMREHPGLKGKRLPKRSALAAYLAQFKKRLYPARRGRTKRAKVPQRRAKEVHEIWAIDFKREEVVEGCGAVVAPLMISDEASGAPLAGYVHEVRVKGRREGITVEDVQQDLRHAFTLFGLPDAIRMDRDPLLVGSTRLEWPGKLLLWLVGLGIILLINRPHRPTDNPIVERGHWTWECHVLMGRSYPDVVAVQKATDQDLAYRRDHLPSRHPGCDGRPPAQAFPTLYTPRRPYSPEQEEALFDLRRVDLYLSQWEWRRTVDSEGKISLANRNYRVGKAYRGQSVKVRFDIQTREFVCWHVDGRELARWFIPEVSQEYLLATRHRPPPQQV
ncbi:MAG: hypothetical protein D6775_13590 [Caldilineae bacterium]|nr:MAG: hypothetical protein D6775_13590 [Caldilineae bacterium]